MLNKKQKQKSGLKYYFFIVFFFIIIILISFFYRDFVLKNVLFVGEKITQSSQVTNSNLDSNPTNGKIILRSVSVKSNLYENVWVKKNDKDLVEIGDFVFGENNVVLGNINQIKNNLLEIKYLGSKDAFIAKILNSDELIELKSSGLGLYAGEISKSSVINLGDILSLKDNAENIVGTVVSVEENETSIKKVWVKSPFNISKINTFYVEAK